jgi:hypothetical protein
MSIEDTLRRIREESHQTPKPAPAPSPGETAQREPTECAGPPGDILDDPLVNQAMEIFGAEVESWGGVPPKPEGWK